MSLILFIPSFIISIFLAFYIPGRVILGFQKNLSRIGLFSVSFILGIVLWGWQGYVFGFLQTRWLSYVYLLVFLAIFIKKKYYTFKIPKIHPVKFDWVTLTIITIGIIGQIMPFIKYGQITPLGLFISNYNNVDHIWHVDIVSELVRRFPPNEPGMYGILLVNYHFWFHLVTAELIRVFYLPIFSTQFIGMYPLATILLALIGYSFAVSLCDSKLFLRLFIFLLYFSNDARIWFDLLIDHKFTPLVGSSFEDATKFMDLPGRGFAVIISLAALYILYKNKEKISWEIIFFISLLIGSLMGFKVYFGIPFLFGMFCLSIYGIFKKKSSYFWIFIISFFLSLIQFLPFNYSSGGLFFLPFEIPRSFIVSLPNMSWIDQRWNIYQLHGNYFRLIEYGILMSFGYLFVQLGVKLAGIIPFKRTIRLMGVSFSILLYSVLFSSIILGLFFYQKLGGPNIWEFFLTGSLILTITVSLNISLYLANAKKQIVIVLILAIIIFIIPRWVNSIFSYLKLDYFSGFHGISRTELESYGYLKNNTPKDSLVAVVNQEKYIYLSSIVSVLSERNLFFSGAGEDQSLTPEMTSRKNDLNEIRTSLDTERVNAILKKDKINYIYIYNKPSTPSAVFKDNLLQKVFSNGAAKIFKVNFNSPQ